jgi:NitT/TauT family transport system ATP-binding protein
MDLVIEQVSQSYGALAVLDGVSLDIRSGEILAVLGPSGCGKSTLLRLMGGLERPTSGQISMAGEPPEDCLNPLTYVFQDFALVPWRTVAANVALPLEHLGLDRRERQRRVEEALRRVNLLDFGHAYPRQLSGGMKQRTSIARALVVNPAILLMDEPLSALDAQTRELLMEDLLGLWHKSRLTAVYVTHNLAEAVRLGHRVAVLSRRPGRIRDIVAIPVPLGERREGHPALLAASERIWSLVRDEAATADRELTDGS